MTNKKPRSYADVDTAHELRGYFGNIRYHVEGGNHERVRELMADFNRVVEDWLNTHDPAYHSRLDREQQEDLRKRVQDIVCGIANVFVGEVPDDWVPGVVTVAGLTRMVAAVEVRIPPAHRVGIDWGDNLARAVHDSIDPEDMWEDPTYYERAHCYTEWQDPNTKQFLSQRGAVNKFIKEWLEKIEAMSYEEMAWAYRQLPSEHPIVDNERLWTAFVMRFTAFGGWTDEISKKIGWDRRKSDDG